MVEFDVKDKIVEPLLLVYWIRSSSIGIMEFMVLMTMLVLQEILENKNKCKFNDKIHAGLFFLFMFKYLGFFDDILYCIEVNILY